MMLLGAFSLHAQGIVMPFLAIDRNPVTLAMGGTRITDGLYNSAAIPFTNNDISLSYQHWAPKTAKASHINLAGIYNIKGKIGISARAALQLADPVNDYTPKEYIAGIGVGYAFTKNLSAGVNFRYAAQQLYTDISYHAFSADIFLLYRWKTLMVSAGIASIGPSVKSGENSYPLPASIKAGASYTLPFGLRLAGDFDYYVSGGLGTALGLQYGWQDTLFARAGYHYGFQKAPVPSFLSLGIGAKFFGFHIDLCYMTASKTLNNTLTLGLGYAF